MNAQVEAIAKVPGGYILQARIFTGPDAYATWYTTKYYAGRLCLGDYFESDVFGCCFGRYYNDAAQAFACFERRRDSFKR